MINLFFEQDPVLIGVYQLPIFSVTTIMGLVASFILQWTGKFKWSYVAWSFVLLLGGGIRKLP